MLLAALRNADSKSALATITRTRGSTFRHAGTHMLVRGNGEVVCELSGGCPQRDIMHRALEVIDTRQLRLVNYNAESGLDVLMEMGCGGELEVLIEPLAGSGVGAFAEALQQCVDERRKASLATWFADEHAAVSPRRMVIDSDGIRHDEIGDSLLRQSILEAIGEQPERSQTLRLPSSRGIADVLIEPVPPPHALTIIGCSATALALLPLADALGWQVTLVDGDPQRLQVANLPQDVRALCARPHEIRAKLVLDADSSVVAMTHNLEQDIAYLSALRDASVAYLGALGSQERAARIRAALDVCNVHAPAGLDIGSETPAQIALAIAAEITAALNDRSGGSLRDRNAL
jgi:xanthine/CO dehydrogenase XdhC/CoxF family maturation factor